MPAHAKAKKNGRLPIGLEIPNTAKLTIIGIPAKIARLPIARDSPRIAPPCPGSGGAGRCRGSGDRSGQPHPDRPDHPNPGGKS